MLQERRQSTAPSQFETKTFLHAQVSAKLVLMDLRADHLAQFFEVILRALPVSSEKSEPQRLSIAYFCVSGLRILNRLESSTKERVVQSLRKYYLEHEGEYMECESYFYRRGLFQSISDFVDVPPPGHLF